ncbi:MFS transporter [Streptomyces sp. NPDC048279]|uniref:MFS transporter n=1 Tax=Streptomyces sp. NPDC048279 TaxID=3154714 RepID=UPI0034363B65
MSSPPQYRSEGTLPPSFRGVLAIALGAFALVVTEFLPVGLLPDISRDLGVSEGTTGLVVTATALLGAVAAPTATVLIRHLDRRTALLGLTGLLIVSAVLSALAHSFLLLIVARIILGIAVGGFWAISMTAAGRLVRPEKVATASATVLGGISVASVVSVPAGAYLGAHADWHIAFAAAAVLGAVVMAVQAVVLPRIPMDQKVSVSSFARLLRLAPIRIILLTVVLFVAGHFIAYTYITPMLQHESGFGPTAASALLLGYGIVTCLGNFAGGYLAARGLFRTVLLTAGLFVVSLLLMAAFTTTAPVAVSALAGWALAWGMAPVATQLWLFNTSRHAPEAAQAMNTSVFQLAIGLGSLTGAVIVNATAVHSASWAATAVLVIATAVVLLARNRTAGASGQEPPATGTAPETTPPAGQPGLAAR